MGLRPCWMGGGGHLIYLALLLVIVVPSSTNRHSRHGREDHRKVEERLLERQRREPKPLSGDEEVRQVRENIYKPIFKDCSLLQPEVDEGAEKGTAVVQVVATDKDAEEEPDSEAGRITYSIVSTNHNFKIDPKTGWLSTNKVFNRDQPDREKEVHVTIKAFDHGRPSLVDVCTIKVKIRDINDNPPMFDKAQYDVRVPQDTEVGEQITRVSATDLDEGENQKITYKLSSAKFPNDIDYFRWDEKTGVVKLQKKLDKPVGNVFVLKAIATDGGIPSKSSEIDVTIEVKETKKKPPKFLHGPGATLDLSEGYRDFQNPIASYTADSQIPGDPVVYFELLNGRTEQTNQKNTFKYVQDSSIENQVNIYLANTLQSERVDSYTLTLQVRNNADLVAEAQLTVNVKDENNLAPTFTNIESGSVLENEKPGTIVMQVNAIDGDKTYPNNKVTYKINDPNMLDKFHINPETGVVTTKVDFDREEKEYYSLRIIAEDGAPNSILKNGKPNSTPNKFRIVIKDKNDNPPYFPHQQYTAEVPEDADIGSKVIEVKAEDMDTEASNTIYSITKGNLNLSFKIEPQTGLISVQNPLDYESINAYELTVRALDGQFSNDTTVNIKVLNRNDIPPKFQKESYEKRIKEESVNTYPILQVSATDPDDDKRNGPQNITYFLDSTNEVSSHFKIDPNDGQINIVKPLDRDRPNGYGPSVDFFVFAKDSFIDETGTKSVSLESFVPVTILLDDVNDNPPYLDMPDGLVWGENQPPGRVGELKADDYDTSENGPPFTFTMDRDAYPELKRKFSVKKGSNNKYYLHTLTEFDREEKKVYNIPIRIADNQGLSAISILRLVIGDKNDNDMAPGASSIFVYNYEGRAPDTEIGRVYVTDPDDWDLPDKTFRFKERNKFPDFSLNSDTGMITMKKGLDLAGIDTREYFMEFIVEDSSRKQTGHRAVHANVTVTVQKIPEEAVIKSGSIRLDVSPEEFISSGIGGREKIASLLKAYLNATYVDVFTVLPSNNGQTSDVRFAAHGSPYHLPERMEVNLAKRKKDLERQIGVNILMIHIDECLYEGVNCEGGCYNDLDISDAPTLVSTNTTSFVGVSARVVPVCGCPVRKSYSSCDANPCLNGGTCQPIGRGHRCTCPDQIQFGPNCEKLAASFRQGWSTHPGLQSCENTTISFHFTSKKPDGLLLYQGPSPNTVVVNLTDYFALELQEGKLRYFLNLGSSTWEGGLDKVVADDQEHHVQVSWTNETVGLIIDGGACSADIRHCQLQSNRPSGRSQFLNSNGPLQVGGLYFGEDRLKDLSKALKIERYEMPVGTGFAGCIKNLTVNQGARHQLYSLGNPSDYSDPESFKEGCDLEFAAAVVALNMNMNFLIAILVCLAIILTAVAVMAMYRRRRTTFSDKDIDCDIRENIINYEDEGGGEGDQTGYDLSVLRMMTGGMDNGGPIIPGGVMTEKPILPVEPAPDIQTFLNNNKERVDGDPVATPYDDLRHYAYEGDGNSGGSLSSLNSGSDADEDLEFEYLHNFGPRFKKLADMYGRESDSESEIEEGVENPAFYPGRGVSSTPTTSKPSSGGPPGSESWC